MVLLFYLVFYCFFFIFRYPSRVHARINMCLNPPLSTALHEFGGVATPKLADTNTGVAHKGRGGSSNKRAGPLWKSATPRYTKTGVRQQYPRSIPIPDTLANDAEGDGPKSHKKVNKYITKKADKLRNFHKILYIIIICKGNQFITASLLCRCSCSMFILISFIKILPSYYHYPQIK